jgi:hypothetical protein
LLAVFLLFHGRCVVVERWKSKAWQHPLPALLQAGAISGAVVFPSRAGAGCQGGGSES